MLVSYFVIGEMDVIAALPFHLLVVCGFRLQRC